MSRSKNKSKFIKIQGEPNDSFSVALLNNLLFLEAENNDKVVIPTKKQLDTAFNLKSGNGTVNESVFKVLSDVNHITIREVSCIDSLSQSAIITIQHPIYGLMYIFVYQTENIPLDHYIMVNSLLGETEIVVSNLKLEELLPPESAQKFYRVVLPFDKEYLKLPENFKCAKKDHGLPSCDCCDNYYFKKDKDYCLIDNSEIDLTKVCNLFTNCSCGLFPGNITKSL